MTTKLIVSQTTQVNRFLNHTQMESVIESLFINSPIKILRVIPRTGQFLQGTSWVYYEHEILDFKQSTFLSFKDLLGGFWTWLQTANLLAMALFQRIAIDTIIYNAFLIGDDVYNNEFGIGKILDKYISAGMGIPSFKVDFQGRTETVRASSAREKI